MPVAFEEVTVSPVAPVAGSKVKVAELEVAKFVKLIGNASAEHV